MRALDDIPAMNTAGYNVEERGVGLIISEIGQLRLTGE